MTDDFVKAILIYILISFVFFIIAVYIVRAIFDIPSIVRLHKTQVRLLEQIAKAQGVDGGNVSRIMAESQINESVGWGATPPQNPSNTH